MRRQRSKKERSNRRSQGSGGKNRYSNTRKQREDKARSLGGENPDDGTGKYRMCRSKTRYRNENDAIGGALYLSFKTGKRVRVYRCPVCGGYHLSTKFYEEDDGDGGKVVGND